MVAVESAPASSNEGIAVNQQEIKTVNQSSNLMAHILDAARGL
jgi:hypothetical protein